MKVWISVVLLLILSLALYDYEQEIDWFFGWEAKYVQMDCVESDSEILKDFPLLVVTNQKNGKQIVANYMKNVIKDRPSLYVIYSAEIISISELNNDYLPTICPDDMVLLNSDIKKIDKLKEEINNMGEKQ